MDDRRRIPRVPVFFVLENLSLPEGEMTGEFQGVVKNITPDGLLLETNIPLAKNGLLQLSFTLPNTRKSLSLEGRVRWVESKKAFSLAGVEFMDLSSDQRETIMEYLLTLGFTL
ncbi:MAG: PilZ domain-containing protein [candidate division FCPU426 bacterium]